MTQKIIFPSGQPGGLNAPFDWRFGRCSHFTIVEKENDKITQVTVIPNDALNAMGGAGIQAAQIVGNQKPTDIVVGNLGPNAINALKATGATLHQVGSKTISTVKVALELFEKGKTQPINSANVGSHTGMGGGRGRGRGMGRK